MIDLSIVIVNYNVRHFLIKCLESIAKADKTNLNIEIIIIDNASVDGSCVAIKEQFPNFTLIENSKNFGFGKANNQGFEIAKGKYVLSLNPDTIIQEDTLRSTIEFLEQNDDCAVVGVKMIDGSGKYLLESKRGLPTLWNSLCKFSGLTTIFPKTSLFSGYYMGHLSEDTVNEVEVLCGAFMMFRSTVLKQLGGFDEDYFMYGEDIDLSQKISAAGYKVYYFPKTRIIHFKGESTKKASFNYIKNFYNAMLIYVSKNYTGINGLAMKVFINIAIYISAGISFIKNNIIANLNIFIDTALLFFVTSLMRKAWGEFYFNNQFYFNNKASFINNIFFVFIMIFSLWLFGHYDKNWKIKRLITGVVFGTLLSLVIYALLPISLRSSRAIILIGSILTFIFTALTQLLNTFIYKSIFSLKNRNYLIVASQKNAEEIKKVISTSDNSARILGYIAPSKKMSEDNPFYVNHIDNLSQVTKAMNIENVVFSSNDLSLQDILDLMTLPDKEVKYLITSGDEKTVVGSESKDKNGKLFFAESNYKLTNSFHLRLKRIFDFSASLVFLILFPFLIFLKNYRIKILPNLSSVLFGSTSWVGYIKHQNESLPNLKDNVFDLKKLINDEEYFPIIEDNESANIYYIKMYSVFIDIKIILKSLTNE